MVAQLIFTAEVSILPS